VDANGDPARRAFAAIVVTAARGTALDALADGEKLDDTVHLAGCPDVGGAHLGDALAIDILGADARVEGQ